MKRKPYENPLKHHRYKRIKHFFTWHKCKICGFEFRREDGWEVQRSTLNPRFLKVEYICNSCIDSEEKLIERLNADEQRNGLPPKRP
jgi:rubredoxin